MVESRISSCGSSRTSFRSPPVTTAPVELRVTITLLVHTGTAELPAIDPHVLLAIADPSDAGATPTEEPPGICITGRNPHNTVMYTCRAVHGAVHAPCRAVYGDVQLCRAAPCQCRVSVQHRVVQPTECPDSPLPFFSF